MKSHYKKRIPNIYFTVLGIEIIIFYLLPAITSLLLIALLKLLEFWQLLPRLEIVGMISLFLTPFGFLFFLSIHYSILSTICKAFINKYRKERKDFSVVFIVLSILGLFWGIIYIYQFLKISQQVSKIYEGHYIYFYIVSVISFSFFFACLKVTKDISRLIQGYTDPKQIVLFLRKFRGSGDYILPALLAGAVGDRFKIVALSSSYIKKSILFLIGGISFISIFKRIFRPFLYVIDFCYTDDENWKYTVETLLKKACYIIVDITNPSGNIQREIEMILETKKEENTFFTKLESKEVDDYKLMEIIRNYNISIDKIITYHKFSKFKKTAKIMRMKLIPRQPYS